MNEYLTQHGAGRLRVRARAHYCGADLSVTITGGELEHIGAVSLAVYEPERASATVSTLTVYTHRDDRVSAEAAKRLSRALGCTVSAAAGVHIDDPAPGELETLLENCDTCLSELEEILRGEKLSP